MEPGTLSSSSIEDELLNRGICATNTHGLSMAPLFKTHRDVIILKKAEGKLKKYDVVLYRYVGHEHIFTLHRIVGETETEYIIRGDNTFYNEYVPKDKILGVLISYNRKGKKKRSVDSFGFKLYSRFWVFIYPLRRFWHRSKGFLRRKIFKKKG